MFDEIGEMNVLSHILSCKKQKQPLLAVLIDPDKGETYLSALPHIHEVDLIMVGGSTGSNTATCIDVLRHHTNAPILLFPGNIAQFSPKADALLFLTLLNARTPDILIDPHVKIAQQVLHSGIESIPMGYILIDGERKSSVEIATKCTPIPQHNIEQIVSTALAGQLLGKQLIYLEAGSGANTPVSIDIIRVVSEQLKLPLIVGGGISTTQDMLQAFNAGADIVVIGNHFEQNPDEIADFIQLKKEKYGK